MAIIKIDDKEYDLDKLSDQARGALVSIQFVDTEIRRLQGTLAALQTAKTIYLATIRQSVTGFSETNNVTITPGAAPVLDAEEAPVVPGAKQDEKGKKKGLSRLFS